MLVAWEQTGEGSAVKIDKLVPAEKMHGVEVDLEMYIIS